MHWVFTAFCGLSLVVVSRELLFATVLELLISVAFLVVENGLWVCGLHYGLMGLGKLWHMTWLLWCMWNPLGPGTEPIPCIGKRILLAPVACVLRVEGISKMT